MKIELTARSTVRQNTNILNIDIKIMTMGRQGATVITNAKVNESRYLYYFWSADQSKSFFQLIISIFIFSQYCPVENCEVTPYCLYRDSLISALRTRTIVLKTF